MKSLLRKAKAGVLTVVFLFILAFGAGQALAGGSYGGGSYGGGGYYDESGTWCDVPTEEVPEPGTLILLGAGLVGVYFLRKRVAA